MIRIRLRLNAVVFVMVKIFTRFQIYTGTVYGEAAYRFYPDEELHKFSLCYLEKSEI